MDPVLERIFHIEAAASRILDDAETRKKEMDSEYNARIETFDRESDADTDQKLAQIRNSLEESRKSGLSSLSESSEKSLNALRSYFEENHEALADEIVRTILGK